VRIRSAAAPFFLNAYIQLKSAIAASMLAMVMYPETQRRAQAQIDAAIGRGRLPEQSDRPSLPYMEAFCREVLRWHSVVPLGLVRVVMEDDWYAGRLIPRGSFPSVCFPPLDAELIVRYHGHLEHLVCRVIQ
jgi:cytochrome P450